MQSSAELDSRPKASPAHPRGPNVTNSTPDTQSLEAHVGQAYSLSPFRSAGATETRQAISLSYGRLDMMHAQCIHTVGWDCDAPPSSVERGSPERGRILFDHRRDRELSKPGRPAHRHGESGEAVAKF